MKVTHHLLQQIFSIVYYVKYFQELSQYIKQEWRESKADYPMEMFGMQPFISRLDWVTENIEGLSPKWERKASRKTHHFMRYTLNTQGR